MGKGRNGGGRGSKALLRCSAVVCLPCFVAHIDKFMWMVKGLHLHSFRPLI
ncbi:hypothetical protein CCACVL1_27092 [Corchorus capsularis]|uniref:Uncharacterized protein n=1 Tax=Corchorus capsularis TaxID=210143 RepID=A0A1R3GC92_COCAP|nr:hypothetical protein CCACVL1_27092 [Corchorus capsularis]